MDGRKRHFFKDTKAKKTSAPQIAPKPNSPIVSSPELIPLTTTIKPLKQAMSSTSKKNLIDNTSTPRYGDVTSSPNIAKEKVDAKLETLTSTPSEPNQAKNSLDEMIEKSQTHLDRGAQRIADEEERALNQFITAKHKVNLHNEEEEKIIDYTNHPLVAESRFQNLTRPLNESLFENESCRTFSMVRSYDNVNIASYEADVWSAANYLLTSPLWYRTATEWILFLVIGFVLSLQSIHGIVSSLILAKALIGLITYPFNRNQSATYSMWGLVVPDLALGAVWVYDYFFWYSYAWFFFTVLPLMVIFVTIINIAKWEYLRNQLWPSHLRLDRTPSYVHWFLLTSKLGLPNLDDLSSDLNTKIPESVWIFLEPRVGKGALEKWQASIKADCLHLNMLTLPQKRAYLAMMTTLYRYDRYIRPWTARFLMIFIMGLFTEGSLSTLVSNWVDEIKRLKKMLEKVKNDNTKSPSESHSLKMKELQDEIDEITEMSKAVDLYHTKIASRLNQLGVLHESYNVETLKSTPTLDCVSSYNLLVMNNMLQLKFDSVCQCIVSMAFAVGNTCTYDKFGISSLAKMNSDQKLLKALSLFTNLFSDYIMTDEKCKKLLEDTFEHGVVSLSCPEFDLAFIYGHLIADKLVYLRNQ
jgi:hypothetical protein